MASDNITYINMWQTKGLEFPRGEFCRSNGNAEADYCPANLHTSPNPSVCAVAVVVEESPLLQTRPLRAGPTSPTRTRVEMKAGSAGILCQPCNGTGWLVCDFCKGQKTNVKSESNRIYRRCPSCRAVGYVLCSSCKVFKCVTFPNYNDGEELSF